MTAQTRELPHDLYLTQVHFALADVGLDPDHHTLDDSDTRGTHCYLRGMHHHPPYRSWPHGLLLIWEWHTGTEADQGEPGRGPAWLWAALLADGSNTEPARLPVDGYANPVQVAAAFDELVETGEAVKTRPGRWRGADDLNAACEAWGAKEIDEEATPDVDRPQPCGEGHCRCYGTGTEHADCACGCDCPRDDDGQLADD